MHDNGLHRFFLSIVLPSIIAIALFILTIFLVILPTFEQNIMDKKKEMIAELTNTAWSLLEEYQQEYLNQNYTIEEAQRIAAYRIEQIRYGGENKDYFWIIDEHPNMIMHPYRHELISTDLTTYQDPNGKRLFVEAANIVVQKGAGFIDYMWQWKDDSTRIVPKLSYVKGYAPWGWIIGTGIYLEDVKEEINILKNRLLRISLLIILIIAIILSYAIHQSLLIENKRKVAEARLVFSRQKYKSLVAASTEGTLMILNQKIIFSNVKFNELTGYDSFQLLNLSFHDLFKADWNKLASSFENPKKTFNLETQLKCKNRIEKDVVLSVSQVQYDHDHGYIIIAKEITQQKLLEKETANLSQELQTALLLMNQPLKPHINEITKCSVDTSIFEAVSLMTRKKRNVLFVHKENEIIGIINNNDLKKRVLAQNLDTQKPIMEIMSSPVISIPETALLFEAVLILKNNNISHLAIKNINGAIEGVISYVAIVSMHQNTVSYLFKEIAIAEEIDQLVKIHKRLYVLVHALIESGDKTRSITQIITSVSDAIASRILELTIEDLGEPPCNFAFMVMGSEGRMEQTFSTDQDNAIVFENLDNENLASAHLYFQKLGKEVSRKLNEVGYKYCEGDIMAQNPKWTQPLAKWKSYFSEWINTANPQSILEASIFFDFRFVYGSKQLVSELRMHVNKAIVDEKSIFFYHLAQSVLKYKPPTNLFGNLVGNAHVDDSIQLDIKKIMLPLVSFARLYSLRNKLDETNTLDRINQLYQKQSISKTMFDELLLSYNFLMHIRIHSQSRRIQLNKVPDNLINISSLTHIEIATIKKILISINDLQTKLNFDFKGTM
jgi:PAS domain S-box-containing protein